ncbi:hypothetical protein SsS58_06398 [Streptomyces scabiei]|uniref:Uncharacterized protein n=1 Tax=Streptomyces scabiei TaxID=1930 RepID=A0A100JUL4_STRSC|nr:hypothetical protein SsS58_06398 [Streptomyces scabiei]
MAGAVQAPNHPRRTGRGGRRGHRDRADRGARPAAHRGSRRSRGSRRAAPASVRREAGEDRRTPRPHPRAVLLRPPGPFRQRRPGERQGRPDGLAPRHRLRPHRQGLLPGRRPQGPDQEARLHQGPRHHLHLDGPDLQEPARAGEGGRRLGRLPRLLDHRLHPGRPALRHEQGPGDPHLQGARQGHEGLLRRHHQPHRRRRRLRREVLRLPLQGRLPLPDQGREALRRHRPRGGQEELPVRRPGLLPPDPGRPGRREEDQGPRLAQRPDDVPQPGRLHLGGRVRHLRRLRRPGRPVDRTPRGRLRHGEDLREVGAGLRHRRLPDRHREAREHGVLDAVGHRARRVRREEGPRRLLHVRRGLLRRHRRDLPVRDPGPPRLHARLPLPGRGTVVRLPGRQCEEAGLGLRRRLHVHDRQGQRVRAGHLPRQP